MQKWLLIVGLLYLGILVFLSWYSQRKVKSQEDFIMAGSKLGLVLGFMTNFLLHEYTKLDTEEI